MTDSHPTILVAGIGNIFLGDDAFGVEVVERLAQRSLPAHVKIVDYGIRSYDLAYALMEPWELVILADAVPRGGPPGTIYTIEPQLPQQDEPAEEIAIDAHSMNPVAVLQLVHHLGGKVAHMLVVGCEPSTVTEDMDGHFGLSVPVRAAVDEAVTVIEELIEDNRKTKAA